MKLFTLILTLLVPMSMFAHAGHGITGNEILHLMMSHYYIFIIVAVVALFSGRAYMLKKRNK